MAVLIAVAGGIAHVDGVVAGIGVVVDIDAGHGGVVGVGGEEAAEVWIEIPRMQIVQADLGAELTVVLFADIALAGDDA